MVKRVFRALAFTLVLVAIGFSNVAAANDAPDWVQSFCNRTAKTVYALAWPTATYRAWSFGGITPTRDGIDLTVRLYGWSGFDDSNLFTDVIITINQDGVRDLRWGYNNGTWPPGMTAIVLAKAVVTLERQYEASRAATSDPSSAASN